MIKIRILIKITSIKLKYLLSWHEITVPKMWKKLKKWKNLIFSYLWKKWKNEKKWKNGKNSQETFKNKKKINI